MMKIPPGYRFKPSDEELISHYLMKKAANESLPTDVIVERDLYGLRSPWQIFDDNDPWITECGDAAKKCIYVFTRLKLQCEGGIRKNRAAGCGTWHGQTGAKAIFDKVTRKKIGKMHMFVFVSHDENMENVKRPHWLMHEFSLAGSSLDSSKGRSDRNYVVCKITKDESKTLRVEPQSEEDKKKKMGKRKTLHEELDNNGQGEPMHSSITSRFEQINSDEEDEDGSILESEILALLEEQPDSGEKCQQPVAAHEPTGPEQEMYNHDEFEAVGCPLVDFGDHMMPLSAENQMPIQIDKHLHLVGDIEVPKAKESEIMMPLPVADQVPEQLPYSADDDDDLGLILRCSLADLEDAPNWMNGLAVPTGPLFVDGFESIYIPQEIQQCDTTCHSKKRAYDFDQQDDEMMKNNKKIRQDVDVDDGWFLL